MIDEILSQLIAIDHSLFQIINTQWTHPLLDWFFPTITDLHKDPRALVVVLPLLGFWIYRKKLVALKVVLVAILAIGLADLISYRVLKSIIQRPRPSEEVSIQVVLRTHHHSGTSFPSNHAANNFAAATVFSLAAPPLSSVFFAVAAAVAYSRVYVGVHYPLDVAGGALLGIITGILVSILFRTWLLPITRKKRR